MLSSSSMQQDFNFGGKENAFLRLTLKPIQALTPSLHYSDKPSLNKVNN